ncbi:cyclophilin-like fold protein [Agromyces sp. NPDC056523]|uniref:cyclophilin-like fold protein n=1 Tax=Agromyces sp. NPDC056523 TaxID=3345850 RepID=UPI0036713578
MTLRMLAPIAAALLLMGLMGAPGCSNISDQPATEPVAAIHPTATGLADRLPVTLEFSDRMGIAQVAQLPAALDIVRPTPISGYHAGDVAYSATDQTLIVFLSDGTAAPSEDLVAVAKVTSGLDALAGCARKCSVRVGGA